MSNTDYYSDRYEPPRRSRRHRNYDDSASYVDDAYSAASTRRDNGQSALIPRGRQDSDSSYVEEVQRDFPPPAGYSSTSRSSRPSYARRASSLDGYDGRYAPSYGGSTRGRDRDDDRSARGRSKSRVDEWRDDIKRDLKDPKRALSKHRNEIGGAALGAVIAAGGKELYDRYEQKEHPRRARSNSRARLAQVGLGVAGALVGAEAAKKIAERQHRELEDEERAYDENGRPHKSRRKSAEEFGRKAAGATAGLIGPVIAAQANQGRGGGYPPYGAPQYGNSYGSGGGRSRGYDDYGSSRGRNRSYGSSRSRERTPEKSEKIQQALKAALTAAAAEGWRSRDEPGGALSGEKLKRIVTAAVSAAGVDALVDKHPDDHGTRNTIVSALAGLLGNRVINGSRDEDFNTTNGGRSMSRGGGRSRSRGRHESDGPGLGGLAGLGAAAAAGKALYDRSRSRSKKRDDDRRGRRSYSSDGYSRSPPRQRSRSVSQYLNKGLSKLGLKEDKHDRDRDRRNYSDDDEYGRSRGALRGGGAAAAATRSSSSSSDSSMDSDTEKKERLKRRGKEYLTAGLASVATINLAHEVFEGYEKNQKRMKQVREGKMDPAEAARLKRMGHVKDAAALGLAALGIKGAVDNWKETRETKHEADEFCRKREEHRRRRQERDANGGSKRRSKSADYTDYYYPAPIYDDQPGYGAPPAVGGPVYQDDNPYSARGAPEPPLTGEGGGRGYDNRRY